MSEVKNDVVNDVINETKAKNATQKLVKGMEKKLNACKKVRVKVSIDNQNKKDLYVTVQINGYTYQIKRGEAVEVPEPVAKLLERAGLI